MDRNTRLYAGTVLFNIMHSRTSSAWDAFRSTLYSTCTSLPVCPEATLPNYTGCCHFDAFILILCAQERAVRGTNLGTSCAQVAPVYQSARWTRYETTMAATLTPSFLMLYAQERALRGKHFGPSSTQPAPLYQSVRRRPYQTVREHQSFLILFAQGLAVRGTD